MSTAEVIKNFVAHVSAEQQRIADAKSKLRDECRAAFLYVFAPYGNMPASDIIVSEVYGPDSEVGYRIDWKISGTVRLEMANPFHMRHVTCYPEGWYFLSEFRYGTSNPTISPSFLPVVGIGDVDWYVVRVRTDAPVTSYASSGPFNIVDAMRELIQEGDV